MGNYRFHYHVTAITIAELAVSSSSGVSAAAISPLMPRPWALPARLRRETASSSLWPGLKIVGWSRSSGPTLYNNGYGEHRIEGIGDKHVTWIHNVLNMGRRDMPSDDMSCVRGWPCLPIRSDSRH